MNDTERVMPNDTEQYKIIMMMYDNEISRFYSRQNLHLGLQMAALAGIIAGLDKLLQHPELFRLVLLSLVFVGFITAIIATRGLTTQNLILKVVLDIENRSKGEWDILTLARRHTKSPLSLNFIFSVLFAWALFLLWVVVLIWMEMVKYVL
jgi:hypothetical protein